jgi:hypothetical protein
MAETSGGSHELLPHLDDGDEGGAAQRVLGILLILLPKIIGNFYYRQEKTICAQKIGENLTNKR